MECIKRARERTGNNTLGMSIKQGKWRVNSTIYMNKKRRTIVLPISDWLDKDDAIAFINAID